MANNFSGDANCVALWKFDNDATDSKGGNDLTEVNTPTYDAVNKKEGTHSIDFEAGTDEYCAIADADLDAGFPGKDGTSEQSFSICCWFKPESISGFTGLVNKYVTTGNLRVYNLYLYNGVLGFRLGYSAGTTATALTFPTACEAGKWYHVAITYDSSDNGMLMRVWDDTAGDFLDANETETAAGDMSPRSVPLEIGRFYGDNLYTFDGLIDEVAFFKDVLTDDEIDQIRAGTYGGVIHEATGTLSGVGTLAGIGSFWQYGAVTLSGTGTLTGIGRLIAIGKGTVSGTGTLAGIGRLIVVGKATLSGTGTLSGIGSFWQYASATLSGVGSLSGKGSFWQYGKGTLSGVGTLAVYIHKEIKLTVAMPARALTVALHPRSLTVKLHGRALTIALHARSLTNKLYNRALTVMTRGEY